MSQDNYALLTRTGRLKEAQRMAGQSVPAITHMAFGDMDRAPTGGETALGHEVHRAALTGWGAYADETAAYFDCYLPAAIGGFVIREVGLIDAAGDLIAIARRSPGLPKTTPENGGGDDFTLRIDVFLEDLDTLVVTVSPIAGLTADNLRNFLYPNNLPVEAVLSSAPGAPIAGGQWIVAANPTGIWTGRTGQIARWRGAWEYETPRAGRMASYWSGTRQVMLRYDGLGWAEFLATATAPGLVQLASASDAAAGTSAALAVTPAGLLKFVPERTVSRLLYDDTNPTCVSATDYLPSNYRTLYAVPYTSKFPGERSLIKLVAFLNGDISRPNNSNIVLVFRFRIAGAEPGTVVRNDETTISADRWTGTGPATMVVSKSVADACAFLKAAATNTVTIEILGAWGQSASGWTSVFDSLCLQIEETAVGSGFTIDGVFQGATLTYND